MVAFPIIQMGEQRHKLTLQFSLHHWSADYSMHHVSWPQPWLEPRGSTSSPGKLFICSRWPSKYKWELGHGQCCGCTNVFALRTCHLCPIHGKQSISYTVLAKPRICSQALGWRREEAAPLSLTREKRPSDRTYRALALEYSKTPQSPRAERKGTQDWILLNLSPGKEESQLFF